MSLAAFGSLSPGFFRELCGSRIASVIENSSGKSGDAIVSFGALTAHSAIMAIIMLVLITVMAKIAFIHAAEKPSINQALNISAFALFPLSVTMLLAIPAALISSTFAIMLIMGTKGFIEEALAMSEDAVKKEGVQYEVVINFDQAYI